MTDTIPQLNSYDDASLETAFTTLSDEVRQQGAELTSPEAQENFRLHWLGRKQGRLKLISDAWLKSAPAEARKPLGIRFNQLKQQIEAALEAPVAVASSSVVQGIDISLPGIVRKPGIAHPLLSTMHEVVRVFHHLGYSTNLGPQVESDFYNFEALNFPPNHPARDTQDTLQIAGQHARPSRDRLLMRTHTSPVQIRTMIAQAPPIRIVIPGKVHRNDAADATHSPIFHQIEGLCVDTNITFSDLKGTLDHAMKALFCGGSGCRKCKHSGWIELLGCGMVDPAVFASVTEERRKLDPADDAYNPEKISGFAFGMGVERIAMMLHGVSDIGQFYSGDMRFLEQFA
jgi:phenylalanyl-tRNA synthetase alpha chain